ncbi:MAG: transaldolase family protein [Methyloprofundus sp.]|nr:transaldolase family protein [Methyloprofundus sp.]MDT8424651.1 transaldolase family protein [Methyloprofundus sp.]
MFELYLDTADAQQVASLNQCLPIFGVTTNPSILAKAGLGVNQALPALAKALDGQARLHVQVVSETAQGMLAEAIKLQALPYDIVVKVPATRIGLAAIKLMKAQGICVLATAIYSVQQGFFAALCGADYLAPYVNRIDAMGANGIAVVADLQQLISQQGLATKLLPASFKNTQQVLAILQLGVASITLPVDIAEQMLTHPAVQPAVDQFSNDWQASFAGQLSFES